MSSLKQYNENELKKVEQDKNNFGTGYYECLPNGAVRHIPANMIVLTRIGHKSTQPSIDLNQDPYDSRN